MYKFSINLFWLTIPLNLALYSHPVSADLLNYFKFEDGSTNWQYVANWSSGILILLLSITATILFFSRRALEVFNDELEQRVQERTADLNESNSMLHQANELLEGEIAGHRDTTQRLHASETYIKSILESMPLMLVGLNKEGVVTQWNKAAEKLTGQPAEKALNRDLWEAYPIIPISKEQVNTALQDQKTQLFRRTQRTHFHYEITLYPLEGAGDTGVVILIDNVTQQVLSENKLIQKDKMSAMGELASSMAHDINLPLQAIIKDVQQALEKSAHFDDVQPEALLQLTHYLRDAEERSQQAATITRNLLEFAHSERDIKPSINITKVMDHALGLASATFATPNGLKFSQIEVLRDYEADLPQVPGFTSELQQVFLSLFRHAFYAIEANQPSERSPKISIKVINCYDALWIKVQHNGRGLTSEEQQFIFEPYFSNEPYNPGAEYDAGKRLSFSYFIVTDHHLGQMTLTSDPEIGTTFHIQLDYKHTARRFREGH
ncbi:MAG: PAS domain S-box-containing protein [Oleiphilaceae bacterium]|jgi:PAS domain S-box-containing protein